MDLNFHVVPERWTMSRFLGGFGAGLDWWLAQCWRESGQQGGVPHEARYAAFHASLQETVPGSAGLLCFPVSNGRQVAGGAVPRGLAGLRLDHGRGDLGRAMLEGAAYEVRWALEEMRQAGLPVAQMWMVGGATRSPVWPQIVADVSGVSLALSRYSHGPALGAALLAGRALGLLDEAPGGVPAEPIEPNRAHAPVYEERFAAYRRMAQELDW
jgi:xylulokinase